VTGNDCETKVALAMVNAIGGCMVLLVLVLGGILLVRKICPVVTVRLCVPIIPFVVVASLLVTCRSTCCCKDRRAGFLIMSLASSVVISAMVAVLVVFVVCDCRYYCTKSKLLCEVLTRESFCYRSKKLSAILKLSRSGRKRIPIKNCAKRLSASPFLIPANLNKTSTMMMINCEHDTK
jgi:hypothetical protein